ncbi:MAG: protoporphyrinogen oxidase [Armatimonadota bacterium]
MSDATELAPRRVVIVGGGVSGLSTAWLLNEKATEAGIPMHITVLEAANRFGGKVRTDTVDGYGDKPFIIEAGPDSFLTQKPWALRLARKIGLDKDILGTNDKVRNIFVLSKGRPVKLPEGVLLVVPTKIWPFVMSPLISVWGKLRMGMDLILPAKKDNTDEALGDFVRRRLGQEALDKIAEPLMAGIYNAEVDKQSILATFPRFREVEQQHGSLIRGMIAQKAKAPSAPPAPGDKTRVSMFVSFKQGTEAFVTALVASLTDASNVALHKTTVVEAIDTNHASHGYTITTGNGNVIEADDIVLTCPAKVAATLVEKLAAPAAKLLAEIRYVSTGAMAVGVKVSDIQKPIHGFGIVVPSSENRPINAITVASTKFDHRAPDDYALLRVFFGGARSPKTMDLSDAEIEKMVISQLQDLVGLSGSPVFTRIQRWDAANPQYDVHHLDLCDKIDSSLPSGIWVTGCSYRGVGMPDCVYQSELLVERMLTKHPEG